MKFRILLLMLALVIVAGSAVAGEGGRGYLGVRLMAVENVDDGKADNGVFIDEVLPGSGAERAGLKQHDRIVSIDGTEVGDVHDLHVALEGAGPEDAVRVTVIRDGAEETATVVLREMPVEHGMRWGVVVDEKRGYLGLHLQPLSPQLAEYFEVDGGLLVSEVVDDGPAMQAGILAGDIVLELDDRPVGEMQGLHELLGKVQPGDEVAVQIQRRGKSMTLFVEAGDHESVSATMELHLRKLHELVREGSAEGNIELVFPEGDASKDHQVIIREIHHSHGEDDGHDHDD